MSGKNYSVRSGYAFIYLLSIIECSFVANKFATPMCRRGDFLMQSLMKISGFDQDRLLVPTLCNN
jgi:hypothetical protein